MILQRAISFLSKKGLLLAVAVGLVLSILAPRPASATPLNLTLQNSPDIFSYAVVTSYTFDSVTNSGSFLASGFVGSYIGPNETSASYDPYMNYNFEIAATVLANGSFSAGRLDIYKGFPDEDRSDQLLAGDLLAVGFSSESATLEFIFNDLSGKLKDNGNFGSQAAVILENSGIGRDGFAASFSNLYYDSFGNLVSDGISDTGIAAVPEPSTVSLLVLGIGALAAAGARKKGKKR